MMLVLDLQLNLLIALVLIMDLALVVDLVDQAMMVFVVLVFVLRL